MKRIAKILVRSFLGIVLVSLLFSCGSGISLPSGLPVLQETVWCCLIYMNGDNDLEAQALRDLNEMEAVGPPPGMEVLILIDRASGFDAGDGDWTGTRLYRLRKDPGGMNYTAVSERLGSSYLGLTKEGLDRELNLGAPGVLTGFLSWAEENYPARYRVLVLWGHGTGWRTVNADSGGPLSATNFRAVSFDDGDHDFLYTAELGAALEGADLDLIGFDTCNAMLLEVAYELRGTGSLMAGSEGLVSAEGWDYGELLSRAAGTMIPVEVAELLSRTFAMRYSTTGGAVFSVVDLTKIEEVMNQLNDFVQRRIDAEEEAGPGYYADLKEHIFAEVEDFYTTPGDLNIDLLMLALTLEGDDSPLVKAVESAVLFNFAAPRGNPDARGLAIHFVPLEETGRAGLHDDAYFRDKSTGYSLDFVEASLWCPNQAEETGLLWHLFYGEGSYQ